MQHAPHPAPDTRPLDVEHVRAEFPLLSAPPGGRALHYLDNAATCHKPRAVLDALDACYRSAYGPVHRGLYALAEQATARYEQARATVARFIGAATAGELVFTRSATEAINLVAAGWAEPRLRAGDELWVTRMEHHSNFLPWQRACQRSGARLRIIELAGDGSLGPSTLAAACGPATRLIAVTHVSNVLGVINPIRTLVERARARAIPVLVDAAQSVPHLPVDVAELGCDFLAFSAHKMCGPTGIGVLWGRKDLLEVLPPFLGGGEMIETVSMDGSTYAPVPHKFEAGTPPIAPAVGLGAAVDYLDAIGMERVEAHEHAITAYALDRLQQVDGLRIIGPYTPDERGAAISFALGDLHPHDVGQVLDDLGIAVRVGHHCARPVCQRYHVPATTRASFYLYSTFAEVDALVDGLEHVKRFFA